MAISLSKKFIRQISQPFDHTQTGISLWTLDDIEDKQRKDEEEAERAMNELGAVPPPPPAAMRNGDLDVDMDYDGLDDEALAKLAIPAAA
jgi:DNA excision repair protein ERCC-2